MNPLNPPSLSLRLPAGSEGASSQQSGDSGSGVSGWSTAQSGSLPPSNTRSQPGSRLGASAHGFGTGPDDIVSTASNLFEALPAGAVAANVGTVAVARSSLQTQSSGGGFALPQAPSRRIIHGHPVNANGNIEGLAGLHPGALASVTVTDHKLGGGRTGRVDKVIYTPLGQTEAVELAQKTFYTNGSISKNGENRFLNEVRALDRLNGKAAPALWDYSTKSDHLRILMSIPEGVTLSKYPGESTFKSTNDSTRKNSMRNFAQSFLESLQLLHAKDICHRDIKPDNLFVKAEADGSFKVTFIDMGLTSTSSPENYVVVGTNKYAGRSDKVTTPIHADLYSVGVVLRELAGETIVAADSFSPDDESGAEAVKRCISGDFEAFTQKLKDGAFKSVDEALSDPWILGADLHETSQHA